MGCNSQKDQRLPLKIIPVLEVIDLTKESTCFWLLFKVTIRNNSSEKIFFPVPELQAWQVVNDSLIVASVHVPIDIRLRVYPQDYFENLDDEIKNKAYSLADYILSKQRQPRGRPDIQRKIFGWNIIFLDPQKETQVIKGVTFLRQLGKHFKLVASTHRPIDDFDKILGEIPSTFNGYRYERQPLLSDTLNLEFQTLSQE